MPMHRIQMAPFMKTAVVWLSQVTAVFMNGAIWILCIGIFYLLFFWKKSPEERDVTIKKT